MNKITLALALPAFLVFCNSPQAQSVVADFLVAKTNFQQQIASIPDAPTDLSYDTPNTFTAGTSIANLTPTVTGMVDAYTVSPNLPDGLDLDAATGIISGTPTSESAQATYTITATNVSGSTTFDIEISVNPQAPDALSYATPNVFVVGNAISDLIPSVVGNVDSYSISISPSLPNGLDFDTATGIISGTPTSESAQATYAITATNVSGNTTFDIEISVNPPAPDALVYATPNVFIVGNTISDLIPSVVGNVDSYSISPSLPNGLDFNTATGIISGTPTSESAQATYTITAINVSGNTTFDIEISVNPQAPDALVYATPNVFIVGNTISDLIPSVVGNVDSYSISPSLPNGLDFNTATGVISGTPTSESAQATYTITAINVSGNTTFDIEISVNPQAPDALVYATPNVFIVGNTILDLIPAVIGTVDSYSISPSLPNGLDFDTATGIISGTPTSESAQATYAITATNVSGDTTFDIEISVNPQAPDALVYATPNVFIVGNTISDLIPSVVGNVDSYSISPSLPNGLDFDTATGIISGTPTSESAQATYTITAINVSGSTTFDIEISVNPQAPDALSYATPNVFVVGNTILDLIPAVTGTVDSYSISPSLPNGLDFDTATGIISGTPTSESAQATYTITAINVSGNTTFDIEISVNPQAPDALNYATPNVFIVGNTISDLIPSVVGNVDSYSISPSLPNGLDFDTATGIISGTPTSESAQATYAITATNVSGSTTFNLEITVNEAAPSNLSYNSPNSFASGSGIVPLSPAVTGNVASYSVSPALPAGLTLDTTTGVISGIPTTPTATATYTVTATNISGSASFGVGITVNYPAPGSLSYASPQVYTVNTPISFLFAGINGFVTGFSVSPPLPDGLALDPIFGYISGTPTSVTPISTYVITASNFSGSTSFGLVITVKDIAPSALGYTSPNTFIIGQAISNLTPTVAGNVASFSISPNLPDGLSFNAATGAISGTPTTATATATYTVTATNSGGSATFGVVITVNEQAPSALSYTTPNVFTAGTQIGNLVPSVTGDVVSYSVSPSLPDGLSMDPFSGIIFGIPTTAAANATFTITATNAGGSATFAIEIAINEAAPSNLSYNTPNVFVVGNAISPLSPSVDGNVDNYEISPNLPAGLTFNTNTGVISGTPTAQTATQTYIATASNETGSVDFNVVITVNMPAPGSLSYTSPNVYTAGTAISPLFAAIVGSVDQFTVSPALPAGLSLNPEFGIISGTPTQATPTATYTVTASNASGSSSFGLVITVNQPAPSALSYTTPNVFTTGTAITALTPTVTGTVTSYGISQSLPSGLSLDAETGVISGTPTVVSAAAIYTITATNSGGSTSFNVSIAVNAVAPSALSYASPNTFTVGTAITALTPTVTGTVVSYSVSPVLPDGLSLNFTTGVISGTPATATATSTYNITATNSGGNTSFGVVITVNPSAPTALSYTTPNVFTVGNAIAALAPTVTGIVTSYSVSPSLPAGLSLDATTGAISGTPATATAAATYTITATNVSGSATFDVSIAVNDNAPSDLSYPTPLTFTVGTTIANASPTVTGNVTSYSISPGLPAGLSFNTTTGVISGTPTQVSATTTYFVIATNSGGNTLFQLSVTVNAAAPTALSYTTPNVFQIGNAIATLTPTVTGTVTSYGISPGLPSGLTFDTTTGAISGTPTVVAATAVYTVTAANSGGNATFGVSITVNDSAPLALSYPTPLTFNVNTAATPVSPAVTGNVTSYSISPGLPDGLVFDTTTGVISGTPATVTATATYTVTAANSGGSTTFQVSIAVDPELGVGSHEALAFSVYPNPFSEYIMVKNVGANAAFKLFSIDGKLVKNGRMEGDTIRLDELPQGIFLLQIDSEGKSGVLKIVKR